MDSHRSPSPPPDAVPAPGAITFRDDVLVDSLPAAAWNSLAPGQPLLSHALFSALHGSGCASQRTGWRPRFLTGWRGERLVAALPLYEKTHSYGEYVFDWAWADFYRRNAAAYYPKLVAAVPFTPATGPRLLVAAGESPEPLLDNALRRLREPRPGEVRGSSLHLLFITAAEADLCARLGMMVRHGLQFHWTNPGYRDFDDYLAAFNHDRRKKIRQERRKLAAAGVTFERKTGEAILPEDWAHFHRCYENTYHAHGSTPYLDLAFFRRLGEAMPEALLLIVGRRNGVPVCAALDVFGGGALWGRHWGATEPFPGLHFEACYYQAIEFCIERGIARFEGGAQGLHKLARGLLPVPTYSAHAVADTRFAPAIADFCARERASIAAAQEELTLAAPLRHRGEPDRPEAGGADGLVIDITGPANREP